VSAAAAAAAAAMPMGGAPGLEASKKWFDGELDRAIPDTRRGISVEERA
jgi:hypothetical protein